MVNKHGFGAIAWDNGWTYRGFFKSNRIFGYGEYFWADGRKYKGQWRFNLMHGEGIFTWKNGIFTSDAIQSINYEWNNNCFNSI